jgi:hypothetical protein
MNIEQLFWEILGTEAIGNLFLLIASIVGVSGSFILYQKKKNDKRKSARTAIKSELESMREFDMWMSEEGSMDEVPIHTLVHSPAYEALQEDLYLLTDEEREIITLFYSEKESFDEIIEFHRESILEVGKEKKLVDTGREERKSNILHTIDRLAIKRWKAIQILRKHLGEEYENIDKFEVPEKKGNTILKKHPFIRRYGEMLVDEGWMEEHTDSELRLTEKGEKMLEEKDLEIPNEFKP